MRAVHISPYAPDPHAGHAGGQFLAAYLAALADRLDLTVVVPIAPEDAVPDVPYTVLTPRIVPSHIRRAPRLRRWDRTLRGFSPEPGTARAVLSDPQVRRALGSAEVVEIHFTQMLPLLGALRRLAPGAGFTAFEYDVMVQSLHRQRAESTAWRRRAALGVAERVTRRREPALLNRCHLVHVFSDKDRRQLEALGVSTPIDVVRPSIVLPDRPSGPAGEDSVLFVGALWRRENQDAARWLLDEVWPTVAAERAESSLTIAGADPPPWLRQRSSDRIHVTGFVPDLAPLYRQARVVVAPLRSGAGVKFKVLDAMAHALPVVATSVAAEGIAEESGPEAFAAVTDEPAAFARAIVSCLRGDAGIDAGRTARAWLDAHHDFGRSVDAVVERYRELAASDRA